MSQQKVRLVEELENLRKRDVKSFAGAMVRHQEVKALEAQIHYLELGEEISRVRVDQELQEILALEQEISRLSRSVEEKKQNLHFYLFGPAVKRLF